MEDLTKPLLQVRIINRNDFRIVDRFNGVRYVFEPGKPLQVSPAVAGHVFGFKPWDGCDTDEKVEEAMIRYAAKRHGWNRVALDNDPDGIELKLARERFAKIDIEPVRFKIVEDDEPVRKKA